MRSTAVLQPVPQESRDEHNSVHLIVNMFSHCDQNTQKEARADPYSKTFPMKPGDYLIKCDQLGRLLSTEMAFALSSQGSNLNA